VLDVFVVRRTEAARTLVEKLVRVAKPGQIIFVTDEEFEELKAGVIRLQLPKDQVATG
jgi:hypothetical protein